MNNKKIKDRRTYFLNEEEKLEDNCTITTSNEILDKGLVIPHLQRVRMRIGGAVNYVRDRWNTRRINPEDDITFFTFPCLTSHSRLTPCYDKPLIPFVPEFALGMHWVLLIIPYKTAGTVGAVHVRCSI